MKMIGCTEAIDAQSVEFYAFAEFIAYIICQAYDLHFDEIKCKRKKRAIMNTALKQFDDD